VSGGTDFPLDRPGGGFTRDMKKAVWRGHQRMMESVLRQARKAKETASGGTQSIAKGPGEMEHERMVLPASVSIMGRDQTFDS